ncbi:MAG: hypothetical protein KGL90_14300 [Burkholderiales bacterium]|nr:hypothetical protein [Burkholderiales bacterium]
MIARNTSAPTHPISFNSSMPSQAPASTPPKPMALAQGQVQGSVCAKYFGHGSLSVRSSVTGQYYRFEGHGDTQPIDRRDHLMLGRIPELSIR